MIEPQAFYAELQKAGVSFFTGVPDSLLKSFCAYVTATMPPEQHIIAANEGGAVGLALGYHMATGKVPLVYMQNSGLGNIVNPLLSLADREVYSTPMLMLIGWRGQPGVKDEPQHVKQGRVMCAMLDAMEIPYANIGHNGESAKAALDKALGYIAEHNAPYALLVEKGAFADYKLAGITEDLPMTREEAIKAIIGTLPEDAAVVGTTGMASRELFEARAHEGTGHHRDFLTVGGMGHASQIALGIALNQPERTVVCLDGDGAALMHMGAMAIIANQAPANFIHIVINNGVHGSVGGQPTVARDISMPQIAEGCGYKAVHSVDDETALTNLLQSDLPKPALIEVNVKQGHRSDLGRPTSSPQENKGDFMRFLKADKP
ncbi:phosphonopyruvate decarboxylase [Kordiimonas sp.]|uniref:phosphonopyruvate decarboxylase n=1 Tax=Kordiimonas sp. TaxID=1970157 RepID=UPI003A9126B7